MVKDEPAAIIPKDIYNFNDDASNSSVNDVLKLNSPPANRSQEDDKEAAKILVSLSEEKKAKKSSPKKPTISLNSPPNSTKQQNANSFQSSFSSNSFPKVSPGTTPLSPTGNLFNPFSNLSTGTPISSVPTPPLFTKGEPAAYPKPPVLFKPSSFSPVNRSDSGFESSANVYGHGAHFENNSLNSGIIPPKPPIKTLAEKKALPDITLPLSLPKKERKDKRKKEKTIRDEKKEKVKKPKKLDVSEEFSDEEVKDEDVVLPKLTVKISGGTSSATPSPSSTASSTKIVIQGGTPPISPGIKKDKKIVDDKDKKDKKKRKNSLREKALSKSLTDAASCTVITETISTGENGGKLWICPACKTPDDGTPMIGCDECDDWYHWVCVGIKVPPKDEDSWFCDRCIAKQQQIVHKLENKKCKDKRLKDNKRHCDHDEDEIEDSVNESLKTPTLVPKIEKKLKTSTGKGRGRPPKNPPLISRLVEDNEPEEKVWVCPQCEKEDDGTPMIGCDGCEDWYHWICVGIIVKPKAEEVWLCPRCKKKKKTATASKVK
ncbi:hypothetical protein B4U80_05840 [Leptotrombidium deliense]|uniref:PHD-type domain-containing protein n=1 Tax=Leptotrombidium deliense TaxID=299467 RepID=A0A443SLI0_9ACAR|nr:hypothetical protein B4U80_05840 [Leptotrombidium deliense]